MAHGKAKCGCAIQCFVYKDMYDTYLQNIEINYCSVHSGRTPADDHYFVSTKYHPIVGGAFMEATCLCGVHVVESGLTNYTTMLAVHINQVLKRA